jgi:hypothetical protein
MRASILAAACLSLAACVSETSNPAPDRSATDASLQYVIKTETGDPLLVGQLKMDVLEDSTISGTWSSHWVPGADRSIEVGDQIGDGTLAGRQSEDGLVYIDLNPGYADNNVTLVATPIGGGFTGTWHWSTIAGIRTQGRFSADPS